MKAAAESCSSSTPELLPSTLLRRSEAMTPRSDSTISGSNDRFWIRSASRSKMRSSADRGNQSWYTVTFSLV